MEKVPIANLEAELSCLDEPSTNAASRPNHGDQHIFFEAPAGSTSRLDPPSKTKSFYSFGIGGTLAWTTPAGELLQVASCIDNKLLSAEYKRSLERGRDYSDRGKMLERAVNQPYGSGFGIGLSLKLQIEPFDTSWIYNRWPRFSYLHKGLEIRLQYYIDSESIIQDYQIRNTGQEEVILPYSFNSDVVFHEHKGDQSPFHPITTRQCPERLLLFGNSEVLIRNNTEKCQLAMALFLNGQRQPLWTDNSRSEIQELTGSRSVTQNEEDNELEDKLKVAAIERRLQKSILEEGRLVDEDAEYEFTRLYRKYNDMDPGLAHRAQHENTNFAVHNDSLIVPRESTQGLLAIIRISGFPTLESSEPDLKLRTSTHNVQKSNDQSTVSESIKDRIRSRQRTLLSKAKQFSSKPRHLREKRQISEFIAAHLELGQDCAQVEWVGKARYHLFTACLIAEDANGKFSYQYCDAQFIYAKFLSKYGWYSSAIVIMEQLVLILSKIERYTKQLTILTRKVYNRLASMYWERRQYSKAEALYEEAYRQSVVKDEVRDPVSARFLERVARMQVHQNKYEQARKNYVNLLEVSDLQHQVILSNLGFIERKLGRVEQAISFYQRALSESSTVSDNKVEQLYIRSGLFACLRTSGASPENVPNIAGSLIPYTDVVSCLHHPTYLRLPIKDGPFHFPLTRQLESLLSTCSVPVKSNDGTSGIIFLDADPMNCGFEGRQAYFQFKFLIQCQKHLSKMQPKSGSHREASERINAVCREHLIWAFKIAEFCGGTWSIFYHAGGAWSDTDTLPAKGTPTCSRSREGAYNFSKLWLYFHTWSEEWDFVLDILHCRLSQWLSYLRTTQHRANLWVESEGFEYLKPYDTISPNSAGLSIKFPQYHLSDFTNLWLALKQLEAMIDLIGKSPGLQAKQDEDPVKRSFHEVTRAFEDHQNWCSTQKLRSNILKTFLVPKHGEISSWHISDEQNDANPSGKGSGEPQSNIAVDSPEKTQTSGGPVTNPDNSVQYLKNNVPDPSIIAFQRTINDYEFGVQGTDIATIEAATACFFDDITGQVSPAWQETLNIQKDRFITSFQDPREIALTWFAANFDWTLARSPEHKIEDTCSERLTIALYDSGAFAQKLSEDAPEPVRSWSAVSYETLSILVGSLFEECRAMLPSHELLHDHQSPQHMHVPSRVMGPKIGKRKSIVMPQQVGTASKLTQKKVVDSGFLPDWMYYYSDSFHHHKLDIDVGAELKQIDSVKGLKEAIAKWEESKGFDDFRQDYDLSFPPHVVDSGVKGADPEAFGESGQRQMNVGWYWSAAGFYERLLEPRTFDRAKKRLIELRSDDQQTALICWLTAPEQERTLFLDFLRRHRSSQSFFGERVDWKGNVWETEFHLGFYQLLKDRTPRIPSPLDFDSHLSRIKELPSLSKVSDHLQIIPVAISLRFVGDLRDRSWTCHFFSSVARADGFTGLVNECTDGKFSRDELYTDCIGQRKILEMTYVERILSEMRESSDGILAAFQSELDVGEARDPQSESYEFIHSYSRLHSKAGDILRDVFQQFDLAVRAIEEWEKREDTRPFRSRWSQKDENRYGQKVTDLTSKCKRSVQQLRTQKNRLEEQQKLAEQRHSSLINYMQLQAARTSSRSAEDVRLFTYVTIIFLPLSFSSSLFGMQGSPQGSTVAVMVPTTAVALAVTIFVLSNMKVVDRNWNFWLYKLHVSARRKMGESQHSLLGFSWDRISKELEEAAQLRLIKPEDEKHLPAESKWWYFLFWTSYLLELPIRTWKNPNHQPNNRISLTLKTLISLTFIPAYLIIFLLRLVLVMIDALSKLVRKTNESALPPPGGESGETEAESSTLDPQGVLLTDTKNPLSDEDDWELAIEKSASVNEVDTQVQREPRTLKQSRAANGSHEETPSWWTKKGRRRKFGSEV